MDKFKTFSNICITISISLQVIVAFEIPHQKYLMQYQNRIFLVNLFKYGLIHGGTRVQFNIVRCQAKCQTKLTPPEFFIVMYYIYT